MKALVHSRLKNKFRRLGVRLYYSNRGSVHKKLRRMWSRRCARKIKSTIPELYQDIMEMLKSRGLPVDEGSNKFSDALLCYELTMQRRPKVIWECGSGITTLAFAHAVKRLENMGVETKFYSFEEGPEYLNEQILPAFPKHLNPYVQFILSPVRFVSYRNRKSGHDEIGVEYANHPPEWPDLLLVDGPQYKGEYAFLNLAEGASLEQRTKKPFGSDCMSVWANADKPVLTLFDMRLETVFKIHDLLGAKTKSHFLFFQRKIVFEGRREWLADIDAQW